MMARRDDHSSRSRIAPGLQQPTRGSQQLALSSLLHTGWASPPLLFGLAPRGVFRAPDVAIRAVGSYPTFSPLPNALRRNRQGCGFPQSCRRGENITGGLIFCGTFRSRRKILRSYQWQLRSPRDNPLALPGALPCSPTLLRAEDYGSPDFPPVCFACAEYTGDHPTHPLNRLYLMRELPTPPSFLYDGLQTSHAAKKAQSPQAQPICKAGALARAAISLPGTAVAPNKAANLAKESNHIFSGENEWTIIAAASVLNRFASITAEAVRWSN